MKLLWFSLFLGGLVSGCCWVMRGEADRGCIVVASGVLVEDNHRGNGNLASARYRITATLQGVAPEFVTVQFYKTTAVEGSLPINALLVAIPPQHKIRRTSFIDVYEGYVCVGRDAAYGILQDTNMNRERVSRRHHNLSENKPSAMMSCAEAKKRVGAFLRAHRVAFDSELMVCRRSLYGYGWTIMVDSSEHMSGMIVDISDDARIRDAIGVGRH